MVDPLLKGFDMPLMIDLPIADTQVVEVVRHTAPHHRGFIVLEQFQEREHTLRVLIEPGDAHCPRKSKPRTFGHETTDVGFLSAAHV